MAPKKKKEKKPDDEAPVEDKSKTYSPSLFLTLVSATDFGGDIEQHKSNIAERRKQLEKSMLDRNYVQLERVRLHEKYI